MEQNYSIEEILSAVEEIYEKKIEKKDLIYKDKFFKKTTNVPQNTLKLIEEAEKNNF
tara:strand:- start:950 stop:1120 length:171 start_codon:yes stop_codon:yes gene_type:complete